MDLVIAIYNVTKAFPREETYGIVSQMRRAAVSVPSNIAEGAAGRTPEQFRNFLSIAIGSLNEINTQLELSFRLGYLTDGIHEEIQQLVDECMALTYGLRRSIRTRT